MSHFGFSFGLVALSLLFIKLMVEFNSHHYYYIIITNSGRSSNSHSITGCQ